MTDAPLTTRAIYVPAFVAWLRHADGWRSEGSGDERGVLQRQRPHCLILPYGDDPNDRDAST